VHVVATAGHVDHGKSALVRALTGQEPDRLEEERRRGLTIELGYAWTELDAAGEIAFVDVPGHERFVPTMLSGVGPVPAVLLVVAADDPWMPQTAEHLAALHALGVAHGVVAISRADLADPAAAADRAATALAGTSLEGSPVVPVSAVTGAGLDDLRTALTGMVSTLPTPDPDADVRLWVDRVFSIRGAGTVVTGTLPEGTLAVGDVLDLGGAGVRVRGMQALGRDIGLVRGTARVALNVVGEAQRAITRGSVLTTPAAFLSADVLDATVMPAAGSPTSPPERPLLHVGAAAVATHCRPLAEGLVRLRLDRPLPLRPGDRGILRDPGDRALWGVRVLDPAPAPLRRRGAAAARARDLRAAGSDAVGEVERRGLVAADLLRRLGLPLAEADARSAGLLVADGWFLSRSRSEALAQRLAAVVAEHEAASPLTDGVPLAAAAERAGVPSPALVRAALRPPLRVVEGRVTSRSGPQLPTSVRQAVDTVLRDLQSAPFAAPTADRLRELGLDDRGAAAAAKVGLLLRPAPGVVLAPGADRSAAELLSGLPQPFTTSQARQRLGTSRRVVLPLLEHLDRTGLTRRLPDDRREVTGRT
jgi:selenocysteine-specific elongation factor